MRLSAQALHDRIEELLQERDELKRYIEELERQLERQLEHAEPGLLKEVREYLES